MTLLNSIFITVLLIATSCGLVAETLPGHASIMRETASKPTPRLHNGALCSVEPAVPKVYATTTTGTSMISSGISVDGASGILLTSCTVSPENRIAVSGSAHNSGGPAVNFIAYLNGSGKIEKIQRQNNFSIMRLHFDDSGKLWAVGSAPRREKADAADLLVRAFGEDGAVATTVTVPYLYDANNSAHPAELSLLSSNSQGVVILSRSRNELILVSAQGTVKKHSFELPSGFNMITGFGVSGDHGLFISTQGQSGKVGPDGRVTPNSYGILRWNDASGKWDPADLVQIAQGRQRIILGAKDHKLLVYSKPELTWIPIPSVTP